MANITELIKNIRNAVFGKDVRESIAGAIEQCYEDASENGNANMEVAEARGIYDTLKKRLDNSDNVKAEKKEVEYEKEFRKDVDDNLQTQINALASGSPLVANSISEMANTSKVYVNTSDGKWYYYSGSEWLAGGTYQGIEVADNSIIFSKLNQLLRDFFSYKMEDINITWTENNFYNLSGKLEAHRSLNCFEMQVTSGQVFYINGYGVSNGRAYNFIYEDGSISNCSEGSFDEYIVIPKSVIKIQINWWKDRKSETVLKKCTKLITSNLYINDNQIHYKNFDELLKNSIIEDNEELEKDISGNYYYNSSGELAQLTGMTCTKIDVIANEIYYLTAKPYNELGLYYIFDENDNLLDSFTGEHLELYVDLNIKMPENASYICINSYYDTAIVLKHFKGYTLKQFTKNAKGKIICAGDSLTFGYNNVATNSYVDYVKDYYKDCEVLNYGSNGGASNRLVNFLTNMARDNNISYYPIKNPDYSDCCAVIINIGTNVGVQGSIENSIPQLANANDLENNPLKNIDVNIAINEGFKYNEQIIDSEEDYWNLFANDWYGNVALCIEYIQYKNPKTQIFLLPPTYSSIVDSNPSSAVSISNAMKELVEFYGINYINTLHGIGINRRNEYLYRGDYVHGTNERNEIVGKYVAKQLFSKI